MEGDFEYYKYSEAINRAYCERHGYELIIHRTPSKEKSEYNLHAVWDKLICLQQYFRDCDYFLLNDADSFFYSHDLKIEEELFPLFHPPQEWLLAPSDNLIQENYLRKNHKPTHKVCAGNLLFYNCPEAQEFFEEWKNSYLIYPELRTNFNTNCEQEALNRLMEKRNNKGMHIEYEIYRLMNRYGHFIRHLFRMSDQQRIQDMLSTMRRYGLKPAD